MFFKAEIPFYTVQYIQCSIPFLYSTVQYTLFIQYSTVQYIPFLYSTVQYIPFLFFFLLLFICLTSLLFLLTIRHGIKIVIRYNCSSNDVTLTKRRPFWPNDILGQMSSLWTKWRTLSQWRPFGPNGDFTLGQMTWFLAKWRYSCQVTSFLVKWRHSWLNDVTLVKSLPFGPNDVTHSQWRPSGPNEALLAKCLHSGPNDVILV